MSLYSMWAKKRYHEEQLKNAKDQERHNSMKLSEWLASQEDKELKIFLDQDNTLLYLADMDDMAKKGSWVNNNAIYASIMGHNVGILPRPHAKTFINECRKLGTTYVLTAGISHFQEEVLEAVDLLNLVTGIYGRDNYHEVPKGKRSILIDNLPHTHPNSREKLHAMGGGMFLKVPDWEGKDPKDSALLDTLNKLKGLYHSLSQEPSK